jgi:CelD/BcsL family acetyltransferase involved in cellulose biosynthesis
LRSWLGRKERRLEREHGVRYRLAADPAGFEELLRLHALRFDDGASSAFAGRLAAFHRDFAAVAVERGWRRLWLLEAAGEPVAAWYGIRYGRADCFYQGGRDPAWESHSVGALLIAHTIRQAVDDGMTEYRFLRGGEAYKDRFATGDSGAERIVVPVTATARATLEVRLQAARAKAAIRSRARERAGPSDRAASAPDRAPRAPDPR